MLYTFAFTLAASAAVLAEPITSNAQPEPGSAKPPFIPDSYVSTWCFPGQMEQCQGTLRYCMSKGWEAQGEPKQYANNYECFDERFTDNSPNPLPSGKIAYIESVNQDCESRSPDYGEWCYGTAELCHEAEEGEEACLAGRTPPPSNLPFLQPSNCKLKLKTEKCIGTQKWCQQSRGADGGEEEACLARRKPAPTAAAAATGQ